MSAFAKTLRKRCTDGERDGVAFRRGEPLSLIVGQVGKHVRSTSVLRGLLLHVGDASPRLTGGCSGTGDALHESSQRTPCWGRAFSPFNSILAGLSLDAATAALRRRSRGHCLDRLSASPLKPHLGDKGRAGTRLTDHSRQTCEAAVPLPRGGTNPFLTVLVIPGACHLVVTGPVGRVERA